jgi:hypothetical protein
MLAIALLIAVQPAFIAGAGLFYNLKFMVVLLFCFLPTLYLSNCHPARAAGAMVFVPKALRGLFGVSMISLIVSSMAGVGEVYTEGGALQQRAFSWLGDLLLRLQEERHGLLPIGSMPCSRHAGKNGHSHGRFRLHGLSVPFRQAESPVIPHCSDSIRCVVSTSDFRVGGRQSP